MGGVLHQSASVGDSGQPSCEMLVCSCVMRQTDQTNSDKKEEVKENASQAKEGKKGEGVVDKMQFCLSLLGFLHKQQQCVFFCTCL